MNNIIAAETAHKNIKNNCYELAHMRISLVFAMTSPVKRPIMK